MGLKNGVAMFQRAVDHSLRRVKDIAAAYVDDILIMTLDQGSEKSTILKHEKDVRLVMDELKAHKIIADKNHMVCEICGILWPHFGGRRTEARTGETPCHPKLGTPNNRHRTPRFFGIHQLLFSLCGRVW